MDSFFENQRLTTKYIYC